MIITFFDVKGIVQKEIVPTGRNVNSGFCCEVLRRLGENVRRLRPKLWREQPWLLHNDNAPSHTSVLTQQFLTKNKMAVTPHQTYSPDLAPCDFFLFPKMKLKLKGRRFDTIEDTQAESQRVLDTLDRKGLSGSVPNMEEMVGPVSTCWRELLRGWLRPIGFLASFKIFTASGRKILVTTSNQQMHILLYFYYFCNFFIHLISCRFYFTLITQLFVSCLICSKVNTFNDGHSIRHEFVAHMRILIT